MSDSDRELGALPPVERDLARRLTALAPLLREHESAEAELDPTFARTLRAHLVYGEGVAPHPTFARALRARLLGAEHRPFWRGRTARIGTAVALVVALAIGLLLEGGSAPPAFPVPSPSTADLVFSFPAPPGTLRRLTPTMSAIHPTSGRPFAGRLSFTAHTLPALPKTLPAYRLAPPRNVAVRAGRLLDIRSPVRRVRVDGTTWAVAVDGGAPSHRPLHSVAVSLASGELIYHDRRNFVLPRARRAPGRDEAIDIARHWLTRLGWPGAQMPLRTFGNVPGLPRARQVVLGWIGVAPTATEEATLWVTPDRSVIEAWVWPPVAKEERIAARPVLSAWDDLRHGHLPVAVEGPLAGSGAARVQTVRVVPLLVPGAGGGIYLVPAYRFSGHANLGAGHEGLLWFSLAPGTKR